MRRLFCSVAPLLLASAACAPSIPRLVERHHYREALCALPSADPEDERLIRDALRRDLGAQVMVTTEEIQLADAPSDNAGLPPAIVVARVHVATNALPLDTLRLNVEPEAGSAEPANLKSLAALTRETLPAPRQVTPSTAEELIFGVLAVATFGVLRIEPAGSHTEYPSEAEIKRAAPRASALSERLQSSCSQPAAEGVAVRCTSTFVMRRDGPSPVVFTLAFRFEGHPERGNECVSTETFKLDFGAPSALAASAARTFPGFRRVEDVASSP